MSQTLSDYIYSENNTILDSKVITLPSPDNVCPNYVSKHLICRSCETSYELYVGCGRHDCAVCQAQRARGLFMAYKGAVALWDPAKIQFLTLTIKNVPEISREWIIQQNKHLSNFIKRMKRYGYVFNHGFINKEMTWHEDTGYHYHFHLLFCGDRINLKDPKFNLSNIWRGITQDSFMVKLANVKWHDANHSLRYLLKYVCKVQETDPAMQVYYGLTKKMRYFQTFGEKYGKSPREKLKMLCYKCGSALAVNAYSFNSSPIFDTLPQFAVPYVKERFEFRKLRLYIHTQNKKIVKMDIERKSIRTIEDSLLSREEVLLSKVRHLLIDDHNAAAVEEVLEKDLFFLLSRGCLYQPRADKYEELK